jgi:hypothetical protein
VWQGTLPEKFDAQVREVYEGQGSYWQFIIDIKLTVMEWMVVWPYNLLYTMFRHPFRIIAEFLYRISRYPYMWITGKAMELRSKTEE